MNPNDNKKNGEEEMVQVPLKLLTEMQENMTKLEQRVENESAKNAGLEELFNKADTIGEKTIREKKSFTPKFRTVRLRKYPVAGNISDMKYVVGWSDRGAYQEVDTSGVSRQLVDYIDIFYLDAEKTADGKLRAEKVKLLDLINNGVQTTCKILEEKKREEKVETGEEIDVSIFDPVHGLVSTGEKVDGYYTYSEISYKVQIPGHDDIWIDAKFCNQ